MCSITKIAGFVTLAFLASTAESDVIVLQSGGELHGRLVDTGSEQSSYVVEILGGGQIAVDRFLVERIVSEDTTDEAYRQQARGAPDTVDAHWKLAAWCREHSLTGEAEQHLRRILELEPQHVEARQLLGFRSVGGDWMTRDELMESRGMIKYQGKFRTAQEIALLERAEKQNATLSEWRNRLRRIHRNLADRDPEERTEARRQFEAIRDPKAVAAVVDLLADEHNYDNKLLLLGVLAHIRHPMSFDALAYHALNDPNEEIRAQSLDYLIDSDYSHIATPFIRGLRSPDQRIVNWAAYALQEIGDLTAISPLIDALVTEHRRTIGGNSSSGDQYAFSPTSGGFQFGGNRPRVVRQQRKNPQVLSALVKLSGGQSFDYDKASWRAWLAAQTKAQRMDMRRDP